MHFKNNTGSVKEGAASPFEGGKDWLPGK